MSNIIVRPNKPPPQKFTNVNDWSIFLLETKYCEYVSQICSLISTPARFCKNMQARRGSIKKEDGRVLNIHNYLLSETKYCE